MYTCIVDRDGKTVFHKNLHTTPEDLKLAFEPFRERDMVLAVESTFNWYWLADACDELNVPFVLGHAFGMKAIHGGKTKNDKQDSGTKEPRLNFDRSRLSRRRVTQQLDAFETQHTAASLEKG